MRRSFAFFWSEHFRRKRSRQRGEAVRRLLDALCEGGIYDHLGGGFARYSTDAEWHVPHFEKMLYDNAQILELLALAHAETPAPLYAARAHETFGWLTREMLVEGGGFAASQDADQDGEEGLFFVWTADEIDAALGPESAAFKAAYDVQARWQLGRPQCVAAARRPWRRGSGGGASPPRARACSRCANPAPSRDATTRFSPTGTA